MVGLLELLYNDPSNAYTSTAQSRARIKDSDLDPADLGVPSPPRALQRPEIERLRQAQIQTPSRVSSIQMSRGTSLMSSATRADLVRSDIASETAKLLHSTSMAGHADAESIDASRLSDGSATFQGLHNRRISPLSRSVSMPSASPPSLQAPFPPPIPGSFNGVSPSKTKPHSLVSSRSSLGRNDSRGRLPTPFLQPSELEQLMQPLKQEFIQKQANLYLQAKAAYEQLNEQLTSELPQLIDLR